METENNMEERQRIRSNMQACWTLMNLTQRTAFLIQLRLDAAGVPEAATLRLRIASVAPDRRQEMGRLMVASTFDANHDTVPGDIGEYLGVGLS